MEQPKTNSLKTALYDRHCALGAKMVDFSGWQMPIQYEGIIAEHHAVRQHVGVFDVSHMGRILVEGADAEAFLDYISTNTIAAKKEGSATYTVWSNASGGCVDDVIVYKQDATHFFVIANAGNRAKDLAHVKHEAAKFDVKISDCYSEEGILAVQGPQALSLISKIFPEANKLTSMHFCEAGFEGQKLILSCTGYTGAGGFEIYAPIVVVIKLWDLILKLGASPIGLGARDTLRLEMGYALYGHEINDTIAANESVSHWTVKWKKLNFLGKSALERIELSPNKRNEYGVILQDPGIARAGYDVYKDNDKIGTVTSGGHSPTLNKSIAIILASVKLQENDFIEIQIRQNKVKAKVIKLPFIQGGT